MTTSTSDPTLNHAMSPSEATLTLVDPAAPAAPGVPPLSAEQLRTRRRAAVGALPDDARFALGWLRRGYLVTSPLLPLAIRRMLLRLGGIRIGDMVYGLMHCYFGSANVAIGTGSFVNAGCWFEGAGHIAIGENCMFGPQVMILTSTHRLGRAGDISRASEMRDVRIGDGSWLGARAMVMPGVTIGDGVVIAAGAVVTKDCESGGVYAGVPARRIR
jgi:maltose O-acetyltransferase